MELIAGVFQRAEELRNRMTPAEKIFMKRIRING